MYEIHEIQETCSKFSMSTLNNFQSRLKKLLFD